MLKTKSVFSPIDTRNDGLRILATRFRGRGMPTSRYDVWMANLGPSEKLLKTMLAGRMTWLEFARRYQAELFQSQPLDRDNATIRNHGQKFTLRLIKELARRQHVTLMCQCAEDEPHCHRHLLKKLILSKAI
ncbi:MAG TPA: DUF488 family protein [Verrucomicrobiae bacterium]